MDDEFERRLRDVLRSRRLSINADADLLARVHAGARRRQQRRLATSASAAVAVVAVVGLVAGTATLRSHGGKSVTADQNHLLSSNTTNASTLPTTPGPSVNPSSSISPLPSMSATDPPTAATGFSPMSVTAASTDTYWVLGVASCPPEPSFEPGCLALRMTTDGGKTFTALSAPALSGQPGGDGAKGWVATQIRFGSTTTGWAYGAAGRAPYFFQTTDGGESWSQVTQLPGQVVDLVAASGRAWAVVDTAPDNSTTQQYAIYSTAYGSGTQHWTKAALPFELGSTPPSIVDQDGIVSVLVSGPSRAGNHDHVLIAGPDGTFTDHEGPCFPDMGGRLSNSEKAIWAACPTGMLAALFVSTDRGATWQAQSGYGNFANSVAIGAIDDQHAIVSGPESLLRVGVDGPSQAVDVAIGDASGASFIGFTNDTTGFAIIDHQGATSDLLRTTDGGLHWTKVKIDG